MQPGDILLHGHTHIPAWEPFGDGNLYLNPGSVSIPKEGSEHSYMILKAGEAVWKTLEGEIFHSIKLKIRQLKRDRNGEVLKSERIM